MNTEYAGNVFLITAPSGAGKSSLVNELLRHDTGLTLSVSCTTRAPRAGETHGQDYYFVPQADFESMMQRNEMLESAHVHGNYYGTPRAPLVQALESGHDVLLEIDWQGAQQVRQCLYGVTSIFILPPSIEALAERLRNRGKDSEEVIARRLAGANEEILHANEFEYVIINQEFSVALAQLQQIISSARLRYRRQAMLNPALFQAFGLSSL
jgi:guanylate kinase